MCGSGLNAASKREIFKTFCGEVMKSHKRLFFPTASHYKNSPVQTDIKDVFEFEMEKSSKIWKGVRKGFI